MKTAERNFRKRVLLPMVSLLAAFVCVFAFGAENEAFAQNRKAEQKPLLSKDSILIGDQVLWSKEFTLKNAVEYQPIPYTEVLQRDTAIKGGVEVVADMELEEVSVKDELKTLRAKMLLTSFDSGSYTLPSPIVMYRLSDGSVDTLSLGTSELYVNNLGIDTTSFVPFEIKPQAKYPFSFKVLVPWIIGALILGALVAALLWYLKYRKDKAAGKYADPPHIVALKKLEKLRKDKAWQGGKEKAYYSGITDTLKEYISKRYGFGAIEMTSAEIAEALEDKRIESKLFNELKQMFSLADLVKFAKHVPSITDNENSMHTAVNFVNYSYMRQLDEEKEQQENKGEGEKSVDFYVEEKLKKEEEAKRAEDAILNYKEEK